MSTYTEDNPVMSFRIKKGTKDLLYDIADDLSINPQKLCQRIILNFLNQYDLFDIVIKDPKKRMRVEI